MGPQQVSVGLALRSRGRATMGSRDEGVGCAPAVLRRIVSGSMIFSCSFVEARPPVGDDERQRICRGQHRASVARPWARGAHARRMSISRGRSDPNPRLALTALQAAPTSGSMRTPRPALSSPAPNSAARAAMRSVACSRGSRAITTRKSTSWRSPRAAPRAARAGTGHPCSASLTASSSDSADPDANPVIASEPIGDTQPEQGQQVRQQPLGQRRGLRDLGTLLRDRPAQVRHPADPGVQRG